MLSCRRQLRRGHPGAVIPHGHKIGLVRPSVGFTRPWALIVCSEDRRLTTKAGEPAGSMLLDSDTIVWMSPVWEAMTRSSSSVLTPWWRS